MRTAYFEKIRVGRFGYKDMDELHYDYERQCWVAYGIVLKCGHLQREPGCFACEHAGETVASL